MRLMLLILLGSVLLGCVPPDTTQTRKNPIGGAHLFTEYCVDGVSYIVFTIGEAMSVKYDRRTGLPERCDKDQ